MTRLHLLIVLALMWTLLGFYSKLTENGQCTHSAPHYHGSLAIRKYGRVGRKGEKGEPGVSFPESHDSITKDLLAMMSDLKSEQLKLKASLNLYGNTIQVGKKFFATSGQNFYFLKNSLICQELGGTIATPRNEEENAAIMKLVVRYNTYAFIGLIEGKKPGHFHYLDGTPVNYTNWYAGNPDGKGSENCVEMYTDGTWNDRHCSKNRLTVCEF